MKAVTSNFLRTLSISILVLGLTTPLLAQNQRIATMAVTSKMDIYRANGYDDNSDGVAPAVFRFTPRPGQTIEFPAVNGSWACGAVLPFGPDGSTASPCAPDNINSPVGPFAGYDTTDFGGALVGMFLDDTFPVFVRPPLRFYDHDNSEGGTRTNFLVLSPLIGQVFFIGDGLTGTGDGARQVFRIPRTATHLYLGFVDSCGTVPGCFSDNVGVVVATIQFKIN